MDKKSELLETFYSIINALMTNNTNVIAALFSEDYRCFNLNGDIENRDLVLEVYKSGGVVLKKFDVKDLDITILGDVGIITGQGYISGVYESSTFEHSLRFLDVFIYRESKWQYFMSQNTEIAQPV